MTVLIFLVIVLIVATVWRIKDASNAARMIIQAIPANSWKREDRDDLTIFSHESEGVVLKVKRMPYPSFFSNHRVFLIQNGKVVMEGNQVFGLTLTEQIFIQLCRAIR